MSERRIWLMSYREFREAIEDTDMVILPMGVCEAHGPHLPLGTDILIAEWLSLRVAERVNALVAPPIHYGVAVGLSGYLGTITLSDSTLESLVYEVLSELFNNGFERLIVMNGHGGSGQVNGVLRAMGRAWLELRMKSAMVTWWDLAKELTEEMFGGSGGHAGVDEAALILVINRDLIRGGIEESEIYTLRSGIQAIPLPGSMLAYDEKFRRDLPSYEEAVRFAERLIERIADEVRRIAEGWDRQEV
ncbi:MAG: creatininase family protein [Candidatus Korarchaeota archaeon NZ13-K]|nr:MAG: creatininase family protein [Candidatus Korarchaeota archaeon NZ13-K]